MKQVYLVKKFSLGGSVAFADKASAETVARAMGADVEPVPVIDLSGAYLDAYSDADEDGGEDDGGAE